MNVEQFITEYGYWALLLGALLEGEVFAVAAGFFSHRGYLDLFNVMAVASAGAWIAGQAWYWVGRLGGQRIIDRSPERRARADRMKSWLGRGDSLVYAGFHFAIGFRIITPLALGAMRSPQVRYAVFNAAGSIVWGVAYALVGYYFGHAAKRVFGRLHDEEWLIALIALGIGAGIWYAVRRRQKRRAARVGGTPTPSPAEGP